MRKLVIGFVLLVFAGGAFLSFHFLRFIYSAPTTEKKKIVFEVGPGSFQKHAYELESMGLVSDAQLFTLYARITGEGKKIRIGEYELDTSMRPADILAVLTSGKSILHPLTIPEGTNMYDLAAFIEKAGLGKAPEFLRLARDPALVKDLLHFDAPSLEGYLYPETYDFTKFTGEKGIIKAMVEKYHAVYNEVSSKNSNAAVKGLSPFQITTLASMVEKETGAPEERPLIASVFYNRLAKKMKLQSDPTTMYGILDETHSPITNITREHLLRPTRYNTYTLPGLPAGPIASPGRRALEAVFNPSLSNYLFFVSHNDGTHIFTEKYEDHNKAVKKFQLDPKARQGKSWRDLSKRKKPEEANNRKSPPTASASITNNAAVGAAKAGGIKTPDKKKTTVKDL